MSAIGSSTSVFSPPAPVKRDTEDDQSTRRVSEAKAKEAEKPKPSESEQSKPAETDRPKATSGSVGTIINTTA